MQYSCMKNEYLFPAYDYDSCFLKRFQCLVTTGLAAIPYAQPLSYYLNNS